MKTESTEIVLLLFVLSTGTRSKLRVPHNDYDLGTPIKRKYKYGYVYKNSLLLKISERYIAKSTHFKQDSH
jgi:hypothetical protein